MSDNIKGIVYRPHRSLLCDAMEELKIFKSEEDLIAYVKNDWEKFYHNVSVIIDTHEYKDDRIGWNHTRYVCIIKDECSSPMCVGMCDLESFRN